MAFNGAPPHGAETSGHPTPESRQYTPYRPPAQPLHQPTVQQPGAAHQPQHFPQDQSHPQRAGNLVPAMAGMAISADGMTPAPLRLVRKPVAGPGPAYAAPPPTQIQQPQPHPGYFPPPTPSPGPYFDITGTHQPPLQQHPTHPLSYGSGFPAPPVHQQWHGLHAQMAPGQPTPPALYEMEVHPLSPSSPNAFPGGSITVPKPADAFQAAPTFIAELEGSVPPACSSNDEGPPAAANPACSTPENAPVAQLPGTGRATDLNLNPPSPSSKVEPAQGTLNDSAPTPTPIAAPDNGEGLIPAEKPGPPDHEGLIPFSGVASGSAEAKASLGPGVIPAGSQSGYVPQATSSTSAYPGLASSPNIPVADHVQEPPPPYLQAQPEHGGPAPFHPSALPISADTIQRPASTSPYPQSSAAPVPHWPSNPTSPPVQPTVNSPHLQQAAPASPPPSHHPLPAAFPVAQSHSPSPTPHGAQVAGPPGAPGPSASFNMPGSPFPPQTSHMPAAASYTPAAFPAKPHTFPAQNAPSGPPLTGTFPTPHPSAIPSTPAIALTPHSYPAPPGPQTVKPGKYSGASTSFGGFANSVFSKDTVKWSKKTASRLGGAIKTAASTAHAAATNAQVAASQAALRRQNSTAAAQLKVSSSGPANAYGPVLTAGAPQMAIAGQHQGWPGPQAHPLSHAHPPHQLPLATQPPQSFQPQAPQPHAPQPFAPQPQVPQPQPCTSQPQLPQPQPHTPQPQLPQPQPQSPQPQLPQSQVSQPHQSAHPQMFQPQLPQSQTSQPHQFNQPQTPQFHQPQTAASNFPQGPAAQSPGTNPHQLPQYPPSAVPIGVEAGNVLGGPAPSNGAENAAGGVSGLPHATQPQPPGTPSPEAHQGDQRQLSQPPGPGVSGASGSPPETPGQVAHATAQVQDPQPQPSDTSRNSVINPGNMQCVPAAASEAGTPGPVGNPQPQPSTPSSNPPGPIAQSPQPGTQIQHVQSWPSGYTAAPFSSPATPLPGTSCQPAWAWQPQQPQPVYGQPAWTGQLPLHPQPAPGQPAWGGQFLQQPQPTSAQPAWGGQHPQQPQPLANTVGQQYTSHPASGPPPGLVTIGTGPAQGAPGQPLQQQWGVGAGQAWDAQAYGVPVFAPGQSVQPQPGTGVPPPQHGGELQPAQYGMPQPFPQNPGQQPHH